MLVKKTPELTYKDVTPRGLYMGRRNFLLGLVATGAAVVVGSIAPPLGPSSGPLFYQPDRLLFKCAKNSVRYPQEVWAKDDLGNSYYHWVHADDGEPCAPDQEKTFERCDRLCAGIRAFRKLEKKSVGWIQ